jgi:DNA-binding response OmpR family regulator
MEAALKILAVDDEPSIATSMHYIFARPRYELTSACDGNDALARLSADSAPYDVIITDNNMPHLSGVELVRELKERGFCGKIMVLSAHLTAELREAYAQMNVDVLLDKPFDIHELREKLDLLVA